jgi:hypothetical protein
MESAINIIDSNILRPSAGRVAVNINGKYLIVSEPSTSTSTHNIAEIQNEKIVEIMRRLNVNSETWLQSYCEC